MPYCSKCGGDVPQEDKFCKNCGQPQQADPGFVYVQKKDPNAVLYKRDNTAPFTTAFWFIVAGIVCIVLYAAIFGITAYFARFDYSGTPVYFVKMMQAAAAFTLIPVAWMVPMAINIRRIRDGKSKNTAWFGVVVTLFGSVVSGVLLLTQPKDEDKPSVTAPTYNNNSEENFNG